MSPSLPDRPAHAGAALVACLLADGRPLDDHRLAAITDEEWCKIPAAAQYHGVAGAAHLSLRSSSLMPADVGAALANAHKAIVERHLLAWQVLGAVTQQFDSAAIDHVLLKGPLVAETVYSRPDLRSYADLDVFVRPCDFPRSVELLESTGGQLIEQNWELALHLLKGELNVVMPRRIVVDLHWNLLYDDGLRRSFRWRDTEIIDRAERREIAGMSLFAPDATDQLLHLCAHACLAGCQRLCWLQDIRLVATRSAIDWTAFWNRAIDARLGLVVAVALDRVNRCFGTSLEIDPRITQGGAGWRALVRALDGLRPPWHWRGGSLTGHLVVEGTRTSTESSLKAARHHVGGGLHELWTRPTHPWRHGQREVSSNIMEAPTGGRRGRQAFMGAVAAKIT